MTENVIRIWHWLLAHRAVTALILGAVAATGFPPLGLWPISLAALSLFVVLLRRSSGWFDAARTGWLFGLSHLTVANNWIATAFTYQAEMPAVLGWFAVPLLCLYLAIYPALAALIAERIARSAGTLAFAAALASAWIFT